MESKEPKVRWLEGEIDETLQSLQKLSDRGLRLGVPRTERDPGQSTSEIVLSAHLKITETIVVSCSASYRRLSDGGRREAVLRVVENTGRLDGRSELSVFVPISRDGQGYFSQKISPSGASIELLELCDALEIVDRVTVIEKRRVVSAFISRRIDTIIAWSNHILDARPR